MNIEGSETSPVRVIAYEDLQCPDSAAYRRMLDQHLLPQYASTVAFGHREFPLPNHNWARPAAIAARYFASVNPDAGIAFRRYCASELAEITNANFEAKLRAFAKAHKLDPEQAIAALHSASWARAVEEEYQEGRANGVVRTPTVFVNDEAFIEDFTLEEISEAIDAALAGTKKPS